MYIIRLIILVSLSWGLVDEEKYSPGEPPPETGWKSALKFFSKDSNTNSTSTTSPSDSDATYDQYLSLDNTLYFNSERSSQKESDGRWGLNLGYVWDHASWLSQGIYAQYSNLGVEKRYSLMTGLILPGIETQFPLYLRADVGLGYFAGDFTNNTLSVDYAAALGLRFFPSHRLLFHLEFGSQNYHRLLVKSYSNSWVLTSGLAFIF